MTEFDGSTHFNALMSGPNLHAAYSLREQTQINQYTHGKGQLVGQPGGNNPRVQYDPTMNAAKVTVGAGAQGKDAGLELAWQIRLPFTLIDKTTGESEVSLQWEARFSRDYLDVNSYGIGTYKAFTIARNPSTKNLKKYSLKTRFSKTDPTVVALMTVGTPLAFQTGGTGSIDPLESNAAGYIDWQPGGNTTAPSSLTYSVSDHLKGARVNNPFLIRADKWIRYTASITFEGGRQFFRLWMSDEDNLPVLVIADTNDPTKGFLTDHITEWSGASEFWFELGSSSVSTTNPKLIAWIRNLVVFKNKTVPLKTGSTKMKTATQSGTISIADAEFAVVSPQPPSGQIGKDYRHTFLANAGGVLPYTWSLEVGQWPPGLDLQGNVLLGQPTQGGAGDYDWQIKVTDSST